VPGDRIQDRLRRNRRGSEDREKMGMKGVRRGQERQQGKEAGKRTHPFEEKRP